LSRRRRKFWMPGRQAHCANSAISFALCGGASRCPAQDKPLEFDLMQRAWDVGLGCAFPKEGLPTEESMVKWLKRAQACCVSRIALSRCVAPRAGRHSQGPRLRRERGW
jgi:hypothetical protein